MKVLILLCSLCILYRSILSVKSYNDIFVITSETENAVWLEENTQEDSDINQETEIFNQEMFFGDITDEEVKLFFETIYLEMRYPPLSHSVSGGYMETWFYIYSDYKNPDELKKYFLQFMNEETFNYLFRIFDYKIYNGQVIKNTESEFSRYEVDFDGEREFYIINRTGNTCQIKVPFKYRGFHDVEPKADYGEVWLEKQPGGEWKIVKISQWLNDLICYEFKEYKSIFFINSEKHYEQFLEKYGKNYKGESISTQIIRNGDYILPESDKRLLTESDLEPLTKLSAVLAYYEIEARHGYVSEWGDSFISFDLYFTYYCSWFNLYSDSQNGLSNIEKENQEILQNYINQF